MLSNQYDVLQRVQLGIGVMAVALRREIAHVLRQSEPFRVRIRSLESRCDTLH